MRDLPTEQLIEELRRRGILETVEVHSEFDTRQGPNEATYVTNHMKHEVLKFLSKEAKVSITNRAVGPYAEHLTARLTIINDDIATEYINAEHRRRNEERENRIRNFVPPIRRPENKFEAEIGYSSLSVRDKGRGPSGGLLPDKSK